MATLTYDPTESVEGELSEEEKDSLEVGEQLAEPVSYTHLTLPTKA